MLRIIINDQTGEEATDKDLWEMMDCADKNKDGRLDIEGKYVSAINV